MERRYKHCLFLAISIILKSSLVLSQCPNLPTPNIVLFITDDQDSFLEGMEPMAKTRAWFENGQTFENAFVSTPVCCPSRSSLLTGRYQHNTHVINNTVGGNCYGADWTSPDGLESKSTFAAILHDNTNYETFYAGKYLNRYDATAVPRGWNQWAGLKGNSKYYNYDLNVNGQIEHHGENYEEDYLTDVIGRFALKFLNNQTCEKPFFMMLGTPSPHAPFTPAPQYENHFPDMKAPRIPSFNHMEEDNEAKHWFVRRQPRPLNETFIDMVDDVFRNRWRTLLSVDDMVNDVMTYLQDNQMLENTIVMYTSDHGYHLGTYGLPLDKRMPYETDIRVPLLIRGPNVVRMPHQTANAVITLDLAPTILEVAGLKSEEFGMDGMSLYSLLKNETQFTRDSFLIEYHGEGGVDNGNDAVCRDVNNGDLANLSICEKEWGCKCQDSKNNTYNCLRTVSDIENLLLCQFEDDVAYQELYNLQEDPHQLHNLYDSRSRSMQQEFIDFETKSDDLQKLISCQGYQECNLVTPTGVSMKTVIEIKK